jgi:secreted PhoX family phosphatase
MNKLYKTLFLAALMAAGGVNARDVLAQSVTQSFSRRIASGTDDAEEATATGAIDFTSSDLEFTEDGSVNQVVGIRFTNVTIPANAIVNKAYIQFWVDETTHTAATNLVLKGQASDNADPFAAVNYDLSFRPTTTASANWAPPVWTVANAAGADQATPELKTIIQEIIGRRGWQSGNALAILVTGSGRRNAHAYDGVPGSAPQLIVEYKIPTQLIKNIGASSDDAEERGLNATSGAGSIDMTSSDIELTYDGTTTGDQTIGLRFNGINLPKNATVTKAYIQFTQDEIKTDPIDAQPANIIIKGEAADNAVTFTTAANNISSRAVTAGNVNWSITPQWNIQSEAGPNQQTPDLTALVNEIKNRAGWQTGNALSFIISGTGRRFAQSYDLSPASSAKLIIEYITNQPAPGNFPVTKNSIWLYHDKGQDLGTNWKNAAFDDSGWDFGPAVLGYGDPVATTLSYGSNSSSKQPTSYLRRAFNVTNAALYDTLVFNIRRDDGAVVYLNGVEQFRTNMPAGAITYNTWATATVDGVNETAYFTYKVPATQLVNGLNVLAVEMHQDRASSSDITFDLEMQGQLKQVKTDVAVLPMGGSWKYLANGTDQGTTWKSESFNDTAWSSGNAVLGYGNGDETSKIGFGTDAANKHITTYFRKTFTVADTAGYKALELNLIRDDAAVVYLNGTEVLRSNLMAGALTYQSTAVNFIEDADENTPVTAYINKQLLKQGVNTIAVEVHKYNRTETDLRFNLGLNLQLSNKPLSPVTSNFNCDPKTSTTIGCFTSVKPTAQVQTFVFPETHNFQVIAKSGTTQYSSGGTGAIPGGNDFTGYVGKMRSSKDGFLSINHENSPGGVSMLKLHLNETNMVWALDSVKKVDFNPVVKTQTNCSGGVTPWGTVISSEETFGTGDANNDGYQDLGWQVEIDPATGKVIDHDGNGSPDKLWALGRMSHENIAVGTDSLTIYQAEDGGSSGIYKFVANQKTNLSAGTLYVLKRDSATATTGTWLLVPNTTQADRNNARTLAQTLGATNWNGAEDIEFGPDGKMYFTSKGTGTIWRFRDNGTSVTGIEAWVTNRNYAITHASGTQNENFGTGIDNLTFDGEGNLWALQDGGRGHLWLIRPDHTPANSHVELFATTPAGSEPTGLTFTPDFKYGFISFQHPNGTNTQSQTDASGNAILLNAPTTVVFARKENLGKAAIAPKFELGTDVVLCQGDSIQLKAFTGVDAVVKWSGNITDTVLTVSTSGVYTATAYANNGKTYTDSLRVTVAQMPVANLGNDLTLCGGTATLNAGNPGMTYLWNNGATTQSISAATSGKYFVKILNPVGGCVASDTINVTINPLPVVNLGTDVVQCGGTATLDAGNAGMNFLWSNGATTQTVTAATSGIYHVRVTNPATGCQVTDTINVTINALPVANLGSNIVQCGGTATLNAGNAGMNYLWNTGANTQTILASASGLYSVKITNPATGCFVNDTVAVTIHPNPVVNLGNDTTLCASCNITLQAGTGFASYLWSNGATGNSITVANAGTYSVTVTDANGCTTSDTIKVSKLTGLMDETTANQTISVYPNPFQTETSIALNLTEQSEVKMEVFDLAGKRIETLTNTRYSAGKHELRFRREGVTAKGVYFLHITINDKVAVRKLIKM